VVGVIRLPSLARRLVFRKEYVPTPGPNPILRCKAREPYNLMGPTGSSGSQNLYQLHLFVQLISKFGSRKLYKNKRQDRQYTYNVTLRCICATIVAEEKH